MIEVYRRFVRERDRIWRLRQKGAEGPWTDDAILRDRKFTNVFRALDAGSQYLLGLFREARRDEDVFLTAWLYRYTNRPGPWEFFNATVGEYPAWADLVDGTLHEVWRTYRDEFGGKLYSSAYHIVGGLEGHPDGKLARIFEFAEDHLPRVLPELLRTPDPADRYDLLTTVPACSRFLGMQIVTDLGYSEAFAAYENEFIVPGPGAVRGAREIWPGIPETEIPGKIVELRDRWRFDTVMLDLPDGSWYPPTLMDVQNTLCEFSKYAKFTRLPPRGKPYAPAHPGRQDPPILPTHWVGL